VTVACAAVVCQARPMSPEVAPAKDDSDAWMNVYAMSQADGAVRLAGYYNTNVRVDQFLVRTPVEGSVQMDLRVWPEADVVAAVGRHLECVPELLWANTRPTFQIHRWIDGVSLSDAVPPGARLSATDTRQIVDFFARQATVPRESLPPPPPDWPADGDCAGVAALLLAVTAAVYESGVDEFGSMWRRLGLPDDPLAALSLDGLSGRPFRLVHADVHKSNIIKTRTGLVIIDWELALFGDPIYELASHVHKMGYTTVQRSEFVDVWSASCQASRWPDWRTDLGRYLNHEAVKSAIVDSMRCARRVADDPSTLDTNVAYLTGVLQRARRVWADQRPISTGEVTNVLATTVDVLHR
jgi:aminoglycoside phosphotransferase (APT) family kinase protein